MKKTNHPPKSGHRKPSCKTHGGEGPKSAESAINAEQKQAGRRTGRPVRKKKSKPARSAGSSRVAAGSKINRKPPEEKKLETIVKPASKDKFPDSKPLINKSKHTDARLLKVIQNLLGRYQTLLIKAGMPDEIDPVGFALHLLTRKDKLGLATSRNERACFKKFLRRPFEADSSLERTSYYFQKDRIKHAFDLLYGRKMPSDDEMEFKRRLESAEPKLAGGRESYAKGEKTISRSYFDEIQNHAKKVLDFWEARILNCWLLAGFATGLRPGEWRATDIETCTDPNAPYGRRILLHVLNGKASNGRDSRPFRTLDISEFPPDTLESVIFMSEFGSKVSKNGSFDWAKDRCDQSLNRICKALVSDPNSGIAKCHKLSILRQQFIGNMKSIMEKEGNYRGK